jgi:hypothetical protein
MLLAPMPKILLQQYRHEADIKLRPLFGRFGVESGHHRLVMSISAFDPQQS